MARGHSHAPAGARSHRAERRGGGGRADHVEVRPLPRVLLLGSLVLAGLVTVAGLVLLWPDSAAVADLEDEVQFAAPGVTLPRAVVEDAGRACAPEPHEDPGDLPGDCNRFEVEVLEGAGSGDTDTIPVPPHVAASGLEAGDLVRVMRVPVDGQEPSYSYFGTERPQPLWVLTVLFVLVVLLVARVRGLFALIGLAFAGAIIGWFLLPGVLAGESAILVGLVGSAAIMYVVLYTTHGFSLRTSAALAGTLAGIGLTGLVGWLSVDAARLTGVSDEGGSVLTGVAPGLDFQGLLVGAVMIAGLGVLNDVTITQASAVWELRAASRAMPRRELFSSGMRIGRDHIASTIYTIAFAYTGTALTTLLVLHLYDLPLLQLLSTEEIAQEVARTLVTSIGLVLAVPLTTAIAAVLVPPPVPDTDSSAD